MAETLSRMYIRLHVKNPFFLSYFDESGISRKIFKNSQTSNFKKIRAVGSELFHTGGRTDT